MGSSGGEKELDREEVTQEEGYGDGNLQTVASL